MKVYAVGWSDDLDDIGQWALDRRCYASEADAMKRKGRIEGRGDDGIRRYAHVEELELMDSGAFVTRKEHRRVCAERDELREKLGEAIGHAHEIAMLQDLGGGAE